MSKVAEARAEARRLYVDEGLDIPAIAQRMGRSHEGVDLLLTYGGVERRPPVPATIPADLLRPSAECVAEIVRIEEQNAIAVQGLRDILVGADVAPDAPIAKAFEGACLACGAEPTEPHEAYPVRVRILAASALFRGKWMSGDAAARACHGGDRTRLSPVQVAYTGITDEMIEGVIAFMRGGPVPAYAPDPRPGHIGDQAAKLNETRLPEAKRLYVEQGLSLEATGAALSPPLSRSQTQALLKAGGVPTRPRGTGGPKPGLRADGQPRKPARKVLRHQTRKAYCSAETRLSQPKAISPDVVRWTRAYVGRGVLVEYLADLFDVDPGDLAQAVAA